MEILLLFGIVIGGADVRNVLGLAVSNIGLRMMIEEARGGVPLTENFIRKLHQALLREYYMLYWFSLVVYRRSCVIHVEQYKTRSNNVITRYGDRI